MTEEEARKRWCPFARTVSELAGEDDENRVSVNRLPYGPKNGEGDPQCRCLASGCMAWRWLSPVVDDDGYCGLAGPLPYPVRRPSDDD